MFCLAAIHRTVGLVRAAFRNGNVILADASGAILHVRLVGSALPETGSVVEVLGIPVPDLYHINLVRAIWRAGTAAKPPLAPPPERIARRFPEQPRTYR
ncbi:MAG: hypothetical protein ACI4RD_11225 [Kiritimatiellia bacterium]